MRHMSHDLPVARNAQHTSVRHTHNEQPFASKGGKVRETFTARGLVGRSIVPCGINRETIRISLDNQVQYNAGVEKQNVQQSTIYLTIVAETNHQLKCLNKSGISQCAAGDSHAVRPPTANLLLSKKGPPNLQRL